MKTRVFVASSSSNISIEVSQELQAQLQGTAGRNDLIVKTWFHNVFSPGQSLFKQLLDKLNEFDFSICVFTAEDFTTVNGLEYKTVRDNVLFELGLFLGRLGAGRVCILNVVQESGDDFPSTRIPSDLQGVIYEEVRFTEHDDLADVLPPAVHRIRRWIGKAPPRGSDVLKSRISVIINTKEYYNRTILDGMFETLVNEIVEVYLFSDEGYTNFFNVLHQAISENPRFLIVFPTSKEQSNESEVKSVIESMAHNGADTIFVDNAPDNHMDMDNCWVVKTNVAAGAQAIANHIESSLKRKSLKNVLLVNGPLGNENANIRRLTVTQKLDGHFEILDEIHQTDWREDTTYRLLMGWFKTDRESKPDAIVCANDSMALGATRAVDEAFSSEQLPLIFGYDGIPQALSLIKQINSRFFATLEVVPRNIGIRVAQIIIDISCGRRTSKETIMPLGAGCIVSKS